MSGPVAAFGAGADQGVCRKLTMTNMKNRSESVKKRMFMLAAAMPLAAVLADVNPVDTRWTFGAHEPFQMYRRVGRICTGSIEGNARWLKEWLDWWDESAPAKMKEIGFNYLHSRFYKGMGWEIEKKDFPNVKKFVRNCHANGVKVLAYVQFSTLYPELMRREIPDIETWASYDMDGKNNRYGGQYFRWAPCLNSLEWREYIKKICTIALTEGGFDGIMFDNVYDIPCYCARCQKEFAKHLPKIPDSEDRFGIGYLGDMLLPRYPRNAFRHMETKDPVLQAWALWRCETMNNVMMDFRRHIKSIKADAVVTGNPSPYRSRSRFIDRAQNMAELCKAFDVIIMQNDNFPEVKEGRIYNRVRDLKFAQEMGQRIVALCDNVENLHSDREAKFLMPMIEDVVFGGIPTDRTTMFPSPEEGFVNSEVWNRRKPQHKRFNSFTAAHRDALVAPTIHSVRIFYPEREVMLSEKTHQGVVAAEEIFLRNRVPYGYIVSSPDDVMTVPPDTETIVVPGLVCLNDAQVSALVTYAKKGGKLVVTGDAGRCDGWNAQYRRNPLLAQIAGLPNVSVRENADSVKSNLDWRYTVDAPADGGKALLADLAKVGWKAPVEFEGLPPHVFAEYRRLPDGSLAVHLVNYMPETPVSGAKVVLPDGAGATAEVPFGEDPSAKRVQPDGSLPEFAEYLLLTVK